MKYLINVIDVDQLTYRMKPHHVLYFNYNAKSSLHFQPLHFTSSTFTSLLTHFMNGRTVSLPC